ncbi:MAG: hypothetical protein KAI70_05005 [Candidatus Omnitrophica bacterium]|nr:hypothetical protein [Candidatus Omnitrophota bacterium]
MKNIQNPEYKKEYDTLKRKFAIPQGEKLKAMLSTEDGRSKYAVRKKKWDVFKRKWNIVFMIGDKPVIKRKKKSGSKCRKKSSPDKIGRERVEKDIDRG